MDSKSLKGIGINFVFLCDSGNVGGETRSQKFGKGEWVRVRMDAPGLASIWNLGLVTSDKSNNVDGSLVGDAREFVEHEFLNLLSGAAAGTGSD
jgi:hypothetical protein